MFGWEFPPHITGGLGTACFGLTKGLLKNGVEVLFVVPRSYGDEDQQAIRLINASDVSIDFTDKSYQEYWKQLTYIEIGSNLIPYVGEEEFAKMTSEDLLDKTEEHSGVFSNQYVFSGKYGKNLMEEVTRYALVASTIAGSQQFDVIHAHDWLTYPAGMAAKKVSGKPLVVHMHATEFDRSGENINQNVYEIERKGMEAADAVITVSNYTRDIVIDRYGINPAKVFTVHNGIEPMKKDLDILKKGFKEKLVCFVGRITFQKGPEYFIEAAYKLLLVDKNVRFAFVGEGDMLNRMINRVAQLGISPKFHFTNFLSRDDVDRLFTISDVYVMPSVSEPFGILPLEAMRAEVPVVISKQSGVSEVLKYAIKVDFWDIDATADAIYGLLHYDVLSNMFRKYGKKEINNLKWDDAAFKIKKTYLDVTNLNN